MTKKLLLAGLGMLAFTFTALASEPVFSTGAGAIGGYDPVAYFAEGEPVKGLSQYSYRWNGATWHFSSAEHRDRFRADPQSFAPQYGGYCAYAVAHGATAPTNADAWSIVDGKLYLNYSLAVRENWRKDTPRFIRRADRNWTELLG